MKTASAFLATTLLSFTAIACQQASVANNQTAADNAAATDVVTLPPNETATPPTATPGTIATVIPAAFRGRWGMVPADCTSTKGDAKGLITIGDGSIRFYESTATLTTIATDDPEHFVGNFDFAGEGQTWTKSEDLKLTGSSNTLTRTDNEGSYKYTRCDRPKV